MPRLTFVNLSFNQLCSPLGEIELTEDLHWQNLRNLVLNSTQVPWECIQRILDHLPSLEELHLSLNEYNHVNLCDTPNCHCDSQHPNNRCKKQAQNEKGDSNMNCSCPNMDYKKKHKHLGIKKVHFTGNPVDKWKEICKLGYAFPNLESLVVADCPIRSLDLDSDGEENEDSRRYERTESECESGNRADSPHDGFRKLKFLNLNSTLLCTWDDIERLSRFPALHCLRVQVS